MPVIVGCEVFVDQFTENGDIEIAQGIADDVVCHGRHKDHGDTGDDAGHGERKSDFGKDGKLISAEICGGFEIAFVYFFQSGIEGQDHKRQEVVDHADEGIEVILRFEQTDEIEKFAQGGNAKHEIDPHGQDKDHEQNIFFTEGTARKDVSDRVGDQEAQCRRDNGDGDAHEQGRKFCAAGEESDEISKRKGHGAVDFFRKGIKQNEQHGDNDKQGKEQPVRNAELFA